MKVQIKTLANYQNEFKEFVLKQHLKASERLADEFIIDAKKLLRQTTQNAYTGGEAALKDAVPQTIKRKINPTLKGVSIAVKITVMGQNNNKPHFIWHLLNRGREDGNAKSDLWFPIRNSTRTSVGGLSVKPFTGYTGKYARIPKGKFIGGFLGREWYRTAMFILKKDYKKSKITYKD